MNRISRAELRSLASREETPCVSVYVPIDHSLPDAKQNPVRFRNLIDEAERRLNGELRSTEVRDMLRPARELESDALFWRQTGADGLCVLAATQFFRVFPLPFRCPETAEAGARFHLAPLVHVLTRDDRFHVLALSPKSVRLFRGRGRELTPVALPPDMPTDMATALKGTELEPSLQMHTAAHGSAPGSWVGIMHGHGTPKDDEKPLLREYVRIVCRRLEPQLSGDTSPLVLAAVDFNQSLFRETCRHPHVASEGVVASPDTLTDRELLERALPLVEPILNRDRHKAAERYRALVSSEKAGHLIHTVLPAAFQGRVEAIFAALGRHVYGTCDAHGSDVRVNGTRQPGDVDLLDLAVTKSLLSGGDAFVVPEPEMPTGGPVAAVFRW